ncbi:MAG: hypothetical protein ACF8OB_19625 [Phycisphaeraceae bacterium JB051]
MPSPETNCQTLPAPMISWFENDPMPVWKIQQRLKDHVFTVQPCEPAPGQHVIEAVVLAELHTES